MYIYILRQLALLAPRRTLPYNNVGCNTATLHILQHQTHSHLTIQLVSAYITLYATCYVMNVILHNTMHVACWT